ncbi:MAG: FkbM family methyltransferase [Candidatus Aenigmarchaeota archaeon]|nr:FkbM family methyltransferase [Candidatus Aenigmarchaeota archaeon]
MKKIIKKIIPEKIKRKLKKHSDNWFDGYATKSYSQEGEDMILRRIFEYSKPGFYVDVGAHHPKRFSNTYYFYKKGWSGINIDAMPNSMKSFNKLRPKDKNIESAISDERKKMTYYIFDEPAVNTLDPQMVDKGIKDGYKLIKKQKIITKTLKDILLDTIPKNKKINFMNIDVEGFDLQVIKSNDFNIFRPEYILVEMHGTKVENIQNTEIYKLLNKKNYAFFGKTILTLIFKDQLLK